MKKTHLALLIAASTLATTAQANELGNLQGYYKSKAAIGYSASKIQQNKIEFMNLDKALKQFNASSSPQILSSIDDIANSKTESAIFKKYAAQFKLSNKVCVLNKDGAEIAFEADAGTTVCKFDINSVHKAMASNSKGLTFFKRLGTGADMQYEIDNISADGTKVSTTFLFTFQGQLVGDIAQVTKKSGKYSVKHYADYGKESDDKIGYRSYQWADDFGTGQGVTVNSFAYLYGAKAAIGSTTTPNFWATKDTVTNGPSAGPNFFASSVVKMMQQSTDGKSENRWNYEKTSNPDSKDDLIRYNFNNQHKLIGLSPDSCTIKQIADGTSPVVYYKGFSRRVDCQATASDLAGTTKISTTTLTNDGGKKIAISSLKQSASNILSAINTDFTAQSPTKMTNSEFNAMKLKYVAGIKEFGKFNTIEFWK